MLVAAGAGRLRCSSANRARAAGRSPLGALPPAVALGAYHTALFGRPWTLPLRQHREPRLRADGARGRLPRPVAAAPRGVPRLPDLARLRPVRVLAGAAARPRSAAVCARRAGAAARGGADRWPIAALDVSFPRRDEQLARRLVRGAALHRHGRAVPAAAARRSCGRGCARALVATAVVGRAGRPVGAAQRRVGRALPALPRGVRQPGLRSGVPAARRRLHAIRARVAAGAAGALRRWRRWRWWCWARWRWWRRAAIRARAGPPPTWRWRWGSPGCFCWRSPPTAARRAPTETHATAIVRAMWDPPAAHRFLKVGAEHDKRERSARAPPLVMDISVVLPIYNERDNLVPLFDEIAARARRRPASSSRSSPSTTAARDGSAALIRQEAPEPALPEGDLLPPQHRAVGGVRRRVPRGQRRAGRHHGRRSSERSARHPAPHRQAGRGVRPGHRLAQGSQGRAGPPRASRR